MHLLLHVNLAVIFTNERPPSLYHLFPHPSPPLKFSCDQTNVSSVSKAERRRRVYKPITIPSHVFWCEQSREEKTCEPEPPSHHHQPPFICTAVSLKPPDVCLIALEILSYARVFAMSQAEEKRWAILDPWLCGRILGRFRGL